MTTPETKLKKKVKLWLNNNCNWWSAVSDRYHHGIPDFIGCSRSGHFVAVECKSKTGKLTKKQELTLQMICKSGGYAYVARQAPNGDIIVRMECNFEKLDVVYEEIL